jgi:hypothetical protein
MWRAFRFVIRFTRIAVGLEALPGPYSKRPTQHSAPIKGLDESGWRAGRLLVLGALLHVPVLIERAHRLISKVLLCRLQSSEITMNR